MRDQVIGEERPVGESVGRAAPEGGTGRHRKARLGRLALGVRGVSQLRWLARVGWAEARQVQARFGGDLKWTRQRLRQLELAGLVRSQPLGVVTRAHAYLITTAGIQAAGSPLTAPRREISPATEAHDWCVTTLCALLGAAGIPTTTLREMIAARRFDEITLPIGYDPRSKPRTHYPDLLVHTDDGRTVAIEIERTAKASHRLAQILTLYQGCAAIDRVLYLAEDKLARRIARQAGLLGIDELVVTGPIGEPTVDAWRAVLPRLLELLEASARQVTPAREPTALTEFGSGPLANPAPAVPTPKAPPAARQVARRVPGGPPRVER